MELAQTGNRPIEEAQAVIKAGHPPMANKVVLVDFDGTLYPFGYLFSYPEPLQGAVEACKRLRAAGFRLVIFTSRLSPSWLASVQQTADQHVDYINKICSRDGIEIESVTGIKIPAEAYIDDKAYRFTGDNWLALADQITT